MPVEVTVILKTSVSMLTVVVLAGVALSGCASGNAAGGGDPGAIAMPSGSSCQTVRGELNRLDSKGTPAKVDAASRGAKLAPAQQAEVDRYNQLLNLYLGARCHV
jgi:hypothetical protein